MISRKWREKIDTLVSFRIKLNDNQSQSSVRKLLDLRVRACDIIHLKLPFVANFKNPLLVKEIMFTNSSKENVDKFFSTCTDVEKITFFTTFLGDGFFDLSQDYTARLKKLKKLREVEIGVQVFNSRSPDAKSSVFETVLGNSNVKFPSLSRIFVHYPMRPGEWITFFEFIGRHYLTLKSLKLRCFECPSGIPEVPSRVVTQLKKLNLSTLELICNCSCGDISRVHEVFSDLVSSQLNLETLTLDFHKCPLQVIKDVVRNCQSTLQCVKLCKVEFGHEDEIRGSMFLECIRLRELKLHCLPRVIVFVTLDMDLLDPKGDTKLVSKGAETFGWCFPPSLIHLNIKGCHIPTTELIEMVLETGWSQLKELELNDIGSNASYGYGLTFEAFVALCKNLNKLQVFKFRCVSLHGPQDQEQRSERVKWGMVFKAGKLTDVYKVTKVEFYLSTPSFHHHDDEGNTTAVSDSDLNQFHKFIFEFPEQRTKFLKELNHLISQLDVSEPTKKRQKLRVHDR